MEASNVYDFKVVENKWRESINLEVEESKFTVGVHSEFLYNLIETSINIAHGIKKLYQCLIINNKIEEYSYSLFNTNLRKWQDGRRRIPLNVFLALCAFSNLIGDIKNIRLNDCRNCLNLTYPIQINSFLVFISECIRVEGHLTSNSIIFENTNTELTNKFKESLINGGVDISNVKETLHVKVNVPVDIRKEDIVIENLDTNEIIKKFHQRELRLVSGIKKEIIFIESCFSYDKKLNYRLSYGKEYIDFNLEVPYSGKIIGDSTFYDNKYKKVVPSLRLDVCNKTLVYLLHNCFEIPYGNKSKLIKIPEIIKKCPIAIVKDSVAAVFAAESNVCSKSRAITIFSLSKNYLVDFQQLLLKFKINSKISKNILKICGINNFRRIKDNFNLIIESKNLELNKLLDIKMEQSQKGKSGLNYLKSLDELGSGNFIQIRNNAGRKGNSFRKYIYELREHGYIEYSKNIKGDYIITEKGKSLLNSEEGQLI